MNRAALARVSLAVACSLALTSCARSQATRMRSFSRNSEGIGVRYPDGWTLTTVNHGYVPDPALCFDVSKITAQQIVDLRVVEYLPPYLNRNSLPSYPVRPNHFDLAAFRKGDNDWSPGKDTSFREHQRVFFAGLALPASADSKTRRDVVQILDSLQISSHGRCRPTSGVGSHGVPSATR
ncbi:MAG TPA: hypothetical protein VGU02_00065 [Gaiellaceae bacterium]|nr:hypothetical protein [Gaiellaceae bacterium]